MIFFFKIASYLKIGQSFINLTIPRKNRNIPLLGDCIRKIEPLPLPSILKPFYH